MRRWGSARNGELFIIITILILRKWLGRNYFSQNTCKIYTDKGFILFNSSLGRGFDIRSSQNPGIAKISFSLIVIIWSYGHHNNNHRCAGCLIRRAQFGQSKFGESKVLTVKIWRAGQWRRKKEPEAVGQPVHFARQQIWSSSSSPKLRIVHWVLCQ